MTDAKRQFEVPSLSKRVLTIVGGYGSGKSEVSVNLARFLAETTNKPIAIADLDIVNPYFRSREATTRLEKLGIEAIVPRGGQFYADLPIILPEIKSAIEGYEGTLILDVGGDDAGARVLSSLADAFIPGEYEMLLVVNVNRPFTKDIPSSRQLISRIEDSSRLTFTGLISNSHMMEHTTTDTILQGVQVAEELSRATNLPLVFVSVTQDILEKIHPEQLQTPVLSLDRYLLKPWERKTNSNSSTG